MLKAIKRPLEPCILLSETKTDRFAVCPKLVKSGMSIEREHMEEEGNCEEAGRTGRLRLMGQKGINLERMNKWAER